MLVTVVVPVASALLALFGVALTAWSAWRSSKLRVDAEREASAQADNAVRERTARERETAEAAQLRADRQALIDNYEKFIARQAAEIDRLTARLAAAQEGTP